LLELHEMLGRDLDPIRDVKERSKEAGQLTRSINRLNDKRAQIYNMLGGSSLMGGYNTVVEQVADINAADPARQEVPVMLTVPVQKYEDSREEYLTDL
jgi:hypothetical protein